MVLNKKSKTPIGISVSDISIKAFQLRKTRADIRIQGFGTRLLKKSIIEEGEIKNDQEVSNALSDLFSRPEFGFFSSGEVVLSLPQKLSFTKLIKIENNLNKLEDVIETEIEKYVPYSIKDVYYDYQEISKDKFHHNVLIGVTQRGIVDNYVKLFRDNKLSVVALETESISICRALLQEESPNYSSEEDLSYMILDIGASKTTLTTYAGESAVFSLNLPIAGYDSTVKIAKTLEMDIQKAEKAKVICGLDREKANGVINDILSENINQVLEKLQDSISYFNHQFDFSPIKEIILSGGGANTKNLLKLIEENTKIKTSVGNVFINLSKAEKYEKYTETIKKTHQLFSFGENPEDENIYVSHPSLSGYATSIGAALRNIYL